MIFVTFVTAQITATWQGRRFALPATTRRQSPRLGEPARFRLAFSCLCVGATARRRTVSISSSRFLVQRSGPAESAPSFRHAAAVPYSRHRAPLRPPGAKARRRARRDATVRRRSSGPPSRAPGRSRREWCLDRVGRFGKENSVAAAVPAGPLRLRAGLRRRRPAGPVEAAADRNPRPLRERFRGGDPDRFGRARDAAAGRMPLAGAAARRLLRSGPTRTIRTVPDRARRCGGPDAARRGGSMPPLDLPPCPPATAGCAAASAATTGAGSPPPPPRSAPVSMGERPGVDMARAQQATSRLTGTSPPAPPPAPASTGEWRGVDTAVRSTYANGRGRTGTVAALRERSRPCRCRCGRLAECTTRGGGAARRTRPRRVRRRELEGAQYGPLRVTCAVGGGHPERRAAAPRFAATGIQGSSVVLTGLRRYPSPLRWYPSRGRRVRAWAR